MQLGIFAKTFPGSDPQTVLQHAAKAGFQGVQYNLACSGLDQVPAAVPPGTAEAVARAASATGVTIQALSATFNMAHPDPAIRAQGLARLPALLQAARGMGAGMVTLCTGSRDPVDQWRFHPDNLSRQAWADMTASFAAAIPLAEAAGIDLGIEPEQANVVCDARAARRLIDQMGSPRLVVVLDPANLAEEAVPDARRRIIAEAVDLLADRIAMAHAKDRAANGQVVPAGQGAVDFPDFLARLRAIGFAGPLVTHGLAADDAPAVAAYLRRCLA